MAKTWRVEGLVEGQWSWTSLGSSTNPADYQFATREAAEQEADALARVLGCPREEIRVVEAVAS